MSLTQTKLSRRSRGNNPSAFSLPLKCIWEELVRMDKKQSKKWRFSFSNCLFRNINMAKQPYLLLYSRNRILVPQKWALQRWAFRLSFPRVRARIPSNFDFLLSQPSPITPISYDFGAFSCPSLLSLFGLSFSTFGILQRHFIALVLNFVRKHHLIHCISIYYRDFCEGCESKKCKTLVMRVRACAREAPKRAFFTNENISSSICHFFPLEDFDKRFKKRSDKKEIISDVSPKTWEIFQKTWEIFPKTSEFF